LNPALPVHGQLGDCTYWLLDLALATIAHAAVGDLGDDQPKEAEGTGSMLAASIRA